MDRATIADHLRLAEDHIDKGNRIICEQQARVAVLAKGGHDTSRAMELLRRFEDVQQLRVADRGRLIAELADADRHAANGIN